MMEKLLKTGLIINIILGFGTLMANHTLAKEMYIDNKCQPNQQLNQLDRFSIFYKSDFKALGRNYWLYSAQYQDGAAIVCLSAPNFKQAKPLTGLEQLQFQFITKIVKEKRQNASFLITVAGGNGSHVPMTEYRLNLTNPSKPTLTTLRTWTSN